MEWRRTAGTGTSGGGKRGKGGNQWELSARLQIQVIGLPDPPLLLGLWVERVWGLWMTLPGAGTQRNKCPAAWTWRKSIPNQASRRHSNRYRRHPWAKWVHQPNASQEKSQGLEWSGSWGRAEADGGLAPGLLHLQCSVVHFLVERALWCHQLAGKDLLPIILQQHFS